MPQKKPFKVKVHDFDHPPPHCHVYCSDGTDLRITLPLLMELDGKPVNKEIKNYLLEHLETLTEEWEIKNPKKH